jgi:hypothetical protein
MEFVIRAVASRSGHFSFFPNDQFRTIAIFIIARYPVALSAIVDSHLFSSSRVNFTYIPSIVVVFFFSSPRDYLAIIHKFLASHDLVSLTLLWKNDRWRRRGSLNNNFLGFWGSLTNDYRLRRRIRPSEIFGFALISLEFYRFIVTMTSLNSNVDIPFPFPRSVPLAVPWPS